VFFYVEKTPEFSAVLMYEVPRSTSSLKEMLAAMDFTAYTVVVLYVIQFAHAS
jgi:hypothetical protein